MENNSNRKGKNTISELQKINDELENFFQSTIIPQLFFDKNLILRKYSPAATKQFSLSPKDIGKPLKSISNYLSYFTLEDDINKTISSNRVLEKEIQTTDNRWYRMNILPYVQREINETNGVIITFVDINDYVISLRDLQKTISEHELFIYSVSHDLKAPLNNIEGLIDVLKELIEENKLEECIPIIKMLKSSTDDMSQVLNDLTIISHVQDKKDRIKLKFSDILKEVSLTIKNDIDEAHAQIITEFSVPEITFYRKDLRSILYNLLSNSVKYRSYERRLVVTIKTKKEDDYIVLSVEDNGRGIEESKKEVIFSQFTRVIDNVKGTGIGLYLVSKIVKAQGGKIIVNSKVGEGSEFLIYLKE